MLILHRLFCLLLKEICKSQTQRPVTKRDQACSVSRRNRSLEAVTTVTTTVQGSRARTEIRNGMDGQVEKLSHGINMLDVALVWYVHKPSSQVKPIHYQTYIHTLYTLPVSVSIPLLKGDLKTSMRSNSSEGSSLTRLSSNSCYFPLMVSWIGKPKKFLTLFFSNWDDF